MDLSQTDKKQYMMKKVTIKMSQKCCVQEIQLHITHLPSWCCVRLWFTHSCQHRWILASLRPRCGTVLLIWPPCVFQTNYTTSHIVANTHTVQAHIAKVKLNRRIQIRIEVITSNCNSFSSIHQRNAQLQCDKALTIHWLAAKI